MSGKRVWEYEEGTAEDRVLNYLRRRGYNGRHTGRSTSATLGRLQENLPGIPDLETLLATLIEQGWVARVVDEYEYRKIGDGRTYHPRKEVGQRGVKPGQETARATLHTPQGMTARDNRGGNTVARHPWKQQVTQEKGTGTLPPADVGVGVREGFDEDNGVVAREVRVIPIRSGVCVECGQQAGWLSVYDRCGRCEKASAREKAKYAGVREMGARLRRVG